MTKVSVIMPAYNAERYIDASICSVQAQTYEHWELIIINDGSNDNTEEVVKCKAASDTRIKYYYQENGRQGKARNQGIKYACGEFISFLDADDLWMEDKLEWQVKILETSNFDVVFSDCNEIDEFGIIKRSSLNIAEHTYASFEGIRGFLEFNRVPILTAMCKKASMEEVGYFNEDLSIQNAEDYNLWMKMLLHGHVFKSYSRISASYRVHSNQNTSRDTLATSPVITVISELSLEDIGLKNEKDHALIKWIKRYLENNPQELNIQPKVFKYLSGQWQFFEIFQKLQPILPLKAKRSILYRYCNLILNEAK